MTGSKSSDFVIDSVVGIKTLVSSTAKTDGALSALASALLVKTPSNALSICPERPIVKTSPGDKVPISQVILSPIWEHIGAPAKMNPA